MRRAVAARVAWWLMVVGCGGGGGKSCPTVADSCPVAQATRCAGGGIETCTADSGGCLTWSGPASCANDQFCSGTACVACNSPSPCTIQHAQCLDTGHLETCVADANGCLSMTTVACGSGQSCFGGDINECIDDPCSGVPVAGVCSDATHVSICGTPTGQGERQVFEYACPAGTQCQVVSGAAGCQATGSCTPGATVCTDATHLQTCDAGTPLVSACPGSCLTTALGGLCTSPLALTPRNATLTYTVRPAATDLTDWSGATFDTPISSVLVLSFRGSTVLDAETTDDGGGFQILVPTTPDPSDLVVFLAAAADPEGGLAFVVADPGFTTSATQPTGAIGSNSAVWKWSIASSEIEEGGMLNITEELGSGALRVFDYARFTYNRSRALGGHKGLSLVVWLGFGTSWNCGACFNQLPTVNFGFIFQSQLWIPGSLTDERWWSDAVTAHELGHWAMASYGTSPGEGGSHVIGVPSMPGLAWSEGWATWHSSAVRQDSIYYDKQDGAFFWIDLATERYSGGQPWQLPSPSGGLLQVMDENEVSSMLWTIFNHPAVTDADFFNALGSARMNQSPWARGYTWHFWSQLDSQGRPFDPIDTGISRPALPDFLDALVCEGMSPAVIDVATLPTTQYPFPSSQPICQ